MADHKAKFSRRYGIALFETLLEANEKDLIGNTVQNFADFDELIKTSSELNSFLLSPAFEVEEKKSVLQNLKDKINLEDSFYQFLCVLVEHSHFDLYHDIVDSFNEAVLGYDQKVSVNVTSAFDLNEDQKAKVSYALSKKLGKDILLNVEVDSALIGGLKAEVDGVIYDASIKGKLKGLQKEMKS